MSNRGDPFGFDTVLIANRGEIALRVIRACRELGLRSVAVYSTVDRDSLAVRLADDRVAIGPAPARNSYLSIPAIVEAARHSGAQAIHPGYGFLSEDPDFAEVCEAEGLLFIGPPAKVLARLGDKSTARALMSKVGLPLLPGTTEPVSDVTEAERIARPGPCAGGRMTETIVGGTTVGIGEDLVGLVHFLERILGTRVLVDIGMIFARHRTIGGLDLLCGGGQGDAQDLIVVAFLCHNPINDVMRCPRGQAQKTGRRHSSVRPIRS